MRRKTKVAQSLFVMLLIAVATFSISLHLGRAHAVSVAASVPVTDGAAYVAADPKNNMIYASAGGSGNAVTVIDGATDAVATTIALSGSADGIAVNPSTNRIYVANEIQDSLTVIDGSTNTVVGTIALPVTAPSYVAVNPNTDTIYVLTHPNQVVVVNGATDSVTTTITISNVYNTGWIAVNPNTNTVYAVATYAYKGEGSLTAINGATNKVTQQVVFGSNGFYVSVNPANNKVYAADGTAIYAFDGSTNTEIGTIPVPAAGLGVDSETNKIYGTSNTNPGQLWVIDGATSSLLQTLALGDHPFDLSINSKTDKVYVANQLDNTVSAVDDVASGSSTSSTTTDSAPATSTVTTTSTTTPLPAVNSRLTDGSAISGLYAILYESGKVVGTALTAPSSL